MANGSIIKTPHRPAEPNQKFLYDEAKLLSTETDFRLLDLHPSPDHSAPIVFRLSCDSISSPRPYTALSYVWGQGGRTHKATTVGGMDFGITESLDTALRYLRHTASMVTLWIDQICINQEDNKEKTKQVKLMSKIYGLAEQVLVWLGPAADDSDQLVELWKDISQAARDLGIERYWTKEKVGLLRPISRDEVLDQNDDMRHFRELIIRSLPRFRSLLKSMVEWSSRPWFRRVWVVQEFAMPKKAPVYVCGRKMVDSDLVYLAMSVYRLCGGQLLAHESLNSGSRTDVQKLMNELSASPTSAFKVIRKRRQAFEADRRETGRDHPETGDSILDLLRKMYVESWMDATDERDRIFALLGLATDSDTLDLQADYDLDYGLVLVQVARALITKAGRLELLSWSQFPKSGMTLPTWVPDWRSGLASSYNPLVIERAGQTALFSASAGALPSFDETTDQRILVLKGVLVCTAKEVGAEWEDDGDHARRVGHLAIIEQFCKRSAASNRNIYDSPTRREEAIWRVPIGDLYLFPRSSERVRVDNSGQPMMELYNLCVENSRYMGRMGDSEDGRFVAGFDQACNSISYMLSMSDMEHKKPFLTENGYIGMGPEEMTPTDAVIIFAGAHIPHVLRRSSSQGPSGEKYWEYVGEAYCDGVMDGEVWDERKLETFYVV